MRYDGARRATRRRRRDTCCFGWFGIWVHLDEVERVERVERRELHEEADLALEVAVLEAHERVEVVRLVDLEELALLRRAPGVV